MRPKSYTLSFVAGFALFVLLPVPLLAADVNVSFTVPVQIQNIHGNWSKVGVFCKGYPPRQSAEDRVHDIAGFQKIGEIDVSHLSQSGINQTLTGTIQVAEDSVDWGCQLRIAHTGHDNDFVPLSRHPYDAEVKNLGSTQKTGSF